MRPSRSTPRGVTAFPDSRATASANATSPSLRFHSLPEVLPGTARRRRCSRRSCMQALAGSRPRPHVPNGRLRYMLIGYARVSKTDGSQSLDLQRDALRAAGVDEANLYHDFASGLRGDRPGLDSLPARPAKGRRARRLEARPAGPEPRPPGQHRARARRSSPPELEPRIATRGRHPLRMVTEITFPPPMGGSARIMGLGRHASWQS